MSHKGEVYFKKQNITWTSSKTSKWSKSEVKWNIPIVYIGDWTTASTPEPIEISYTHALPIYHWGHIIYSKLVLYMSPMAYLGKVFTLKGYRTCYILQGPVFQCKFNCDVHCVIRLTCYGSFSKFIYIYMLLTSFFNWISIVIMIM